jgi:hypothetical protein
MAAPAIVLAQGLVPNRPYYATNPNQPLAPSPQNPAQQQVLENYRTQLLQTEREMLQQNPSGLSRGQIEVGRQLNTYYPSHPRESDQYCAAAASRQPGQTQLRAVGPNP